VCVQTREDLYTHINARTCAVCLHVRQYEDLTAYLSGDLCVCTHTRCTCAAEHAWSTCKHYTSEDTHRGFIQPFVSGSMKLSVGRSSGRRPRVLESSREAPSGGGGLGR